MRISVTPAVCHRIAGSCCWGAEVAPHQRFAGLSGGYGLLRCFRRLLAADSFHCPPRSSRHPGLSSSGRCRRFRSLRRRSLRSGFLCGDGCPLRGMERSPTFLGGFRDRRRFWRCRLRLSPDLGPSALLRFLHSPSSGYGKLPALERLRFRCGGGGTFGAAASMAHTSAPWASIRVFCASNPAIAGLMISFVSYGGM
jgi:hypothetical protein